MQWMYKQTYVDDRSSYDHVSVSALFDENWVVERHGYRALDCNFEIPVWMAAEKAGLYVG